MIFSFHQAKPIPFSQVAKEQLGHFARRSTWTLSAYPVKMNYMNTEKPTLIDLFAGSGGLSLGLEQAGFETVFVNELNQDAMNTYLMNRVGVTEFDLSDKSRHISDVLTLSQDEQSLLNFAREMKKQHGEISLIAGGPPCQGFSGIGHRRSFDLDKDDIPSNHLYREMASIVEAVQPRMFLFENVEGILSSRWYKGHGEKGEIWESVQSSFRRIGGSKAKKGYKIGWQLVFARDYGVAQNRPRVLMVGVREDIAYRSGLSTVAGGFLPERTGQAPDLIDLLGDLIDPEYIPGVTLKTQNYPHEATTRIQRQLRRKQNGRNGSNLKAGSPVSEMEYSRHSQKIVDKFEYMLANNGEIHAEHQTKKFAQRVLPQRWVDGRPTITATSLPDDYVHISQPRTPTVREWARIQMFPDWYQFSGKRTTGGRRRAGNPELGDWSRDVPKYTQIGNAVPVELARQVGEHLIRLDS